MKEEKGTQLAYELAIAKEKESQLSLLSDIFMTYTCEAQVTLSQQELSQINILFLRAKKGISQFTE
jgi:hypothetical protein